MCGRGRSCFTSDVNFYLRLARCRSRNRRFSSFFFFFFFFLRKLKKKANAPILTPESWHRGVTGHEKANGEVRFSLQGQMEAKTNSRKNPDYLLSTNQNGSNLAIYPKKSPPPMAAAGLLGPDHVISRSCILFSRYQCRLRYQVNSSE